MPPHARRPVPMFLGKPSPSLARIRVINRDRLAVHIESLRRESMYVFDKIERLRALSPTPTPKMDVLIELLARLRALEKAARDQLPYAPGKPQTREERVRAFLDALGDKSSPPTQSS